MKFEELKKSKTYKAYISFITIYLCVFIFASVVLFATIFMDDGIAVFMSTLIVLAMAGLCGYYISILYKIKKTSKTFQACEAKVVNIETGMGRGYLKLVVEFKDMLAEDHRMTSHGIFSQMAVPDYLEKTITIYYSPLWKEVLVKEAPEDFYHESEKEEDPFKL